MARRSGGRPSKIDQPLQTSDGRTITVSERILDLLRAGNYLETAAAAAGVSKESVYEWLRVGAAGATKAHQGAKLTAHEARCRQFSDAIAEAQGTAEAADVARLAQLAQGGLQVVHTTVKVDKDGNEVERTTRTEQLPPSDRVIMWRLERRFGKRWGRNVGVELTGPEGGPIGVDLGSSARELLSSELDRMAARLLAAPDPPPPGVAQPEEPAAAEG